MYENTKTLRVWTRWSPSHCPRLPHTECAQPDVQPSAQPALYPDVAHQGERYPLPPFCFSGGWDKRVWHPPSPLYPSATSALQWWGEVAGSAQHRGEAKLLAMCSAIIRCQTSTHASPQPLYVLSIDLATQSNVCLSVHLPPLLLPRHYHHRVSFGRVSVGISLFHLQRALEDGRLAPAMHSFPPPPGQGSRRPP